MPRVTTPTFQGVLRIPRSARGAILFAHASGTGRLSPRNTYLAKRLAVFGLAALPLDLLTTKEVRIAP